MRCDSTVVAADIRYPTDIDLAAQATRKLAKVGRKLQDAVPGLKRRVRDRSRAVGKRVRALGQTLRRRSGDARAEVARLTQETAAHAETTVREARMLLAEVEDRAGDAGKATARVVSDLRQVVRHAERVADQIQQRFAGERITDRLVSLCDPDARPVRRGKLAQPTEFGYVAQLAEITANTRPGARGLVLPPKLRPGSEHENNLLPQTVEELICLDLSPDEAVFDAGFAIRATTEAMARVGTEPFIVGSARARARPRRAQRRLARYRVGSEGRISHLKRGYQLGRTRLRGERGAQIWASWSVFTYDLDTVAAMN
jgi:IS5 family transposase